MVSPCSKPSPRAKDGTPGDQIVKALFFEAPHFVRDVSVQRKRLYGPIVKQFRSGGCATLWETEPWFGAANRLDRTSSGEIWSVHSVCDPFVRVFLSCVILRPRAATRPRRLDLQLRTKPSAAALWSKGPAADVRVRRQPDRFPDWRPLFFPPGRTVMERRLAAILMTDMVGYSRLMGLDEEGTIAR